MSLVSIHAPAWGATVQSIRKGQGAGEFQSTHPRGVRRLSTSARAICPPFQSTHPRGVRLRYSARAYAHP